MRTCVAHTIQAGMRSTHSPYAVSTLAFTFVLHKANPTSDGHATDNIPVLWQNPAWPWRHFLFIQGHWHYIHSPCSCNLKAHPNIWIQASCLWGIGEVPSLLSGRKRQKTPKSFFEAQCSGSGSQLLNSPISAIACRVAGRFGKLSVHHAADNSTSSRCHMQCCYSRK